MKPTTSHLRSPKNSSTAYTDAGAARLPFTDFARLSLRIALLCVALLPCGVSRSDETVSVKHIADRIDEVTFASRAFGISKHFCVVLPKDYDARQSDWPVLYFLHGRGRNDRSLIDDPSTRAALLNAPFVTVLPNGEDGWYLNSPVRPENLYGDLLDETISVADRQYRLSPKPARRAIAGWSMGGYGAMRTATAHPQQFSMVATILGLLDFPRAGLPARQSYDVPAKTFGASEMDWPKLNPINSADKLHGMKVLVVTADQAFDRTMNETFRHRLLQLGNEPEWIMLKGQHKFDVVQEAVPVVIDRVKTHFDTPKPGSAPTILRTDRVWSAAKYNSFTDMVWHNGRFVLAFREGNSHGVPAEGVPGGNLRILQSKDGLTWTSSALIQATSNEDLRDAKLSIAPDGCLVLTGAAAFKTAKSERQSKAWFSTDGAKWTPAINIGDYNYWLWGNAWHHGQVYSVGYGPTSLSTAERNRRITRLYRSDDGKNYSTLVPSLTASSGLTGGGETALIFRKDGTAVALSRRDTGNFESLIGTSQGDFTNWTWQIASEHIGGPELIELPDGRIVAASRRFVGKQTTTALFWLDPTAGTLTHFLTLPSGGDTSYAGMVWHNDLLWVSYYSSHEGKASVYVSQVQIPEVRAMHAPADFKGDRPIDAAD